MNSFLAYYKDAKYQALLPTHGPVDTSWIYCKQDCKFPIRYVVTKRRKRHYGKLIYLGVRSKMCLTIVCA